MKAKLLFCALLATGLPQPFLKAQTLPPFQVSNSTASLEFRANGILTAKGVSTGGNLLNTDMGAGTKFFWLPRLASFRAGKIEAGGHQWDNTTSGGNTNIGGASLALGLGTMASGTCASALGFNTKADGSYATAWGTLGISTGTYAAVGGFHGFANGYAALAWGNYTTALPSYSAALGFHSQALSYAAVAIGAYNVTTNVSVSPDGTTTWVATDPLFQIGNGTDAIPSDAFIVYKNGTAAVKTSLTAANFVATTLPTATGDIPMLGH